MTAVSIDGDAQSQPSPTPPEGSCQPEESGHERRTTGADGQPDNVPQGSGNNGESISNARSEDDANDPAWIDEDEDIEAFVHATRKTRTKEERESGKGGKAGNQGRFKGEAAEYLKAHQYLYEEIKALEKGRVKQLRTFWHNMRIGLWRKFTVGQMRAMWGPVANGWSKGKLMEKVNDVSMLRTPVCSRLTGILRAVHEILVQLSMDQQDREVEGQVRSLEEDAESAS